MSARFLAVVILLGLVLAPFLPSQRLYVCHMTGAVNATCCCHMDLNQTPDNRHSGCCTVVVVNRFLNALNPQTVPVPIALAVDCVELPTAPLVSWLRLERASCLTAPPALAPPPDLLFVKHCAFLI